MSEKNNEHEFEENMSASNEESKGYESDDLLSEITSQNQPIAQNDNEDEELETPKKKPKKISLGAFAVTCIALVLAAVMITFTCCSGFYRKKLAQIQTQNAINGVANDSSELVNKLQTLAMIFEQLSITDYDSEVMMNEVLKAYVRASGDKYAEYYTPEEYLELMKSNTGTSQGIGISIVRTTIIDEGVEKEAIKIINVTKNSPAEKSGLKINDLIVYVGIGENKKTIEELGGYTLAVAAMQGEAGTNAEFTIRRFNNNGGYEDIDCSILREQFTADAVFPRVCSFDSSVGIVKIDSFDLTTPIALKTSMASLKQSGCTKFVFDVRFNPGGDLKSIEAVLSYFLNEGDTIIKTVDKQGTEEVSVVKAVEYDGDYASCSVKKEEIGMYRDLNFVVLTNGNTASAAELFTAALRDYGLCDIVGTTTYGKGSVQSIFPIKYGLDGAVKLTTRMYYPPCGVSYEGIGIEPSPNCLVELNDGVNIYDTDNSKDNQLVEAIKHIK
jgi:carboxyl-terminal processing protease